MKLFKSMILLGSIALSSCSPNSEKMAASTEVENIVDENGNMHMPANYQANYRFLGTWSVAAAEEVGAAEMHIVYASPGATEAHQKDGHFPDGTVLVKEVYATQTGAQTTGTVSHAKTLKGSFVMVKDSKNSHPGNKIWGDGWGWAWFDAGKPDMTTTVDYEAECKACHMPAEATDWIYVEGYPSLTK